MSRIIYLTDDVSLKDIAGISDIKATAFTIPTASPEADGTIEWNATTIVIVELRAGSKTGIGYTYGDKSIAEFVNRIFGEIVKGKDAFDIPVITGQLIRAIRNNGSCGIAMMAVSAVDIALWDLKAKLLDLPLASLIGKVSDEMLLYGSGGFTTYTDKQLTEQFAGWQEMGIRHFKMKVGAEPAKDVARIKNARATIGDKAELFVDANGAFCGREALKWAKAYGKYNVTWFEEPVPSYDLDGLEFLRQHVPDEMAIAAGEYGYDLPYFRQMLAVGAVDILQGDATRCGGISGFLKAGHLCEAYHLPYSSHCAPAVHLHAALSLPSFYISEYFFDHARVEAMFFDGNPHPENGKLRPDLSRPGLGLEIKRADIKKYEVS